MNTTNRTSAVNRPMVEYIGNLYEDERTNTLNHRKEKATLLDKEIPKNKPTDCDQIPIELLQCLGEQETQVVVDLGQIIYNDEEPLPDFVNN